jgi:hypothetical protein
MKKTKEKLKSYLSFQKKKTKSKKFLINLSEKRGNKMQSQKLVNYEITYEIQSQDLTVSKLPVEISCSFGNEPIEIKCGSQVILIAKSQAVELVQIIEKFRELIFEEERQKRLEMEMKSYLNSTQGYVSSSQILGQRFSAEVPIPASPYDYPSK